jgi:hypothetical protein
MKSYLSDGSQNNNFVSGSNFMPGTAYVIFAVNGTDFSNQGATGNQSGVLFIQSGGFGTGISGVACASVNNIHNCVTVHSGDVIRMPSGSFIWGTGGLQTVLNKAVSLIGAGPSTPVAPGGVTGTVIVGCAQSNTNGLINIASTCTVGNFNYYPTGGGIGSGPGLTLFEVSNTAVNWRVTCVDHNTNFITGGNFVSGLQYIICQDSSGSPGIYTDILENVNDGEYYLATGAGSGMVGGFCILDNNTPFLQINSATVPGSVGLIDNCYINGGHGTNEYIFTRGDGSGWQRPASKGSNNALYIENCTFGGEGYVDMNSCTRAVIRYGLYLAEIKIDNHGSCTNAVPARSCRYSEIYNNVWRWYTTRVSVSSTFMELRGGSPLVFNNYVTNTGYVIGGASMLLKDYGYEQECSMSSGIWQTALSYPILDQIGVGVDPLPWIISGSYVPTNYVQSSGYIFTNYVAVSNSAIPPNSDTGHWSGQGLPWVSGNTYTPGMYASVSGNFYLNIGQMSGWTGFVGLPPSGTIPSSDPFRWIRQSNNARIAASEPSYVFNNTRINTTWTRTYDAIAGGSNGKLASGINAQGFPIGSLNIYLAPNTAPQIGNAISIAGDSNRYLVTGLLSSIVGTGFAIAYPGLLASGTSGATVQCNPNTLYQYQLQQILGHTGQANVVFSEGEVIQMNRDLFWDASGFGTPFSGLASGGVGVGTFAQMMATTPTGFYSQLPVGWWVTGYGVGGWNSAQNPGAGQWGAGAIGNPSGAPGGQLYTWNVPKQLWQLYYTPYAYPHPQIVGRSVISANAPAAVVTIYQA